MTAYGRQVLQSTGYGIQVSSDGAPEWKTGGLTIDWDTVAAVSGADVTLLDGTVIPIGKKYLRYGQVMTRIGVAEVQTLDFNTPTAGTVVVTGTWRDAYGNVLTADTDALDYNATAAEMQSAIENLFPEWVGKVTVTLAGDTYTVTFSRELGNVTALTVDGTDLTNASSGAVTVATGTGGNASNNKFGPYDSSASDGRQTLTRGEAFILNETILEENPNGTGWGNPPTDYTGAIEGGNVFKDRLLMTTGSASLAAGPTVTNFLAAFPRIRLSV